MFTGEKCFKNKICHYLKKKAFLLKCCSYFITNHSVTPPEGKKKFLTVPIILLQRFNRLSAIKDKVVKQS